MLQQSERLEGATRIHFEWSGSDGGGGAVDG